MTYMADELVNNAILYFLPFIRKLLLSALNSSSDEQKIIVFFVNIDAPVFKMHPYFEDSFSKYSMKIEILIITALSKLVMCISYLISILFF